MSINIVEYCLKKYKENQKELEIDLSRALRNPVFESLKGATRQEVADLSIKISEKGIENWKQRDQYLDWIVLELIGDIINSETNELIFKNRKMIFQANVNEDTDENKRFYFSSFKD